MSVFFPTATKSGLGFAVGTSYSTATGQKVSDPEGQKIVVPYPTSIFLTLFNTGTQGSFEIEYAYMDRDPSEATLFTGDY